MMKELTINNPNASARYLKDIRLKRGETQTEAARGLGFSKSTLSRLECEGIKGTTRAVSVVFRLCTYYGINCDELVALSKQPA